MVRTVLPRTAVLIVAISAAMIPNPATAQDVQYRTVTRLDLGTGMNVILGLTGVKEMSETTYLKGNRMRTDFDKSSLIYDADAGRYIYLDHSEKTYASVPFEGMAEAAAALASRLTSLETAPDGAQASATAVDEEGTVDFDFDLEIDPTNERMKIGGHDAERVILTMETDIQVTPAGEQSEDVGRLVLLIDTWRSVGGPAHAAVQQFYQAAGSQLAEQMSGGPSASLAAFSQNPQMAAAMQKAAEEAKQAGGLDVLSTMYMVGLPAGMSLDRESVVNAPQGDGAGEKAKGMLMGALSGRLGGGQQPEPQTDETVRKQFVIFKQITEIRDVKSTSLLTSLFDVPEGYREVPLGGTTGS